MTEPVYEIRNLAFDCPGCGDRVTLDAAPSDRPLICERCGGWGVARHQRLRELQRWFAAAAGREVVLSATVAPETPL